MCQPELVEAIVQFAFDKLRLTIHFDSDIFYKQVSMS
jgi:hypothetical protein